MTGVQRPRAALGKHPAEDFGRAAMVIGDNRHAQAQRLQRRAPERLRCPGQGQDDIRDRHHLFYITAMPQEADVPIQLCVPDFCLEFPQIGSFFCGLPRPLSGHAHSAPP